MKWKITLLTAILMISLMGVYAENVSVELIPKEVNVDVGEDFNLELVVKNIPEDTKCGGLDAYITYDKNILNLTNIQLSDTANTADLKNANVDEGKISLLWTSNPPSGNFTIATLTFKRVGFGDTEVSISGTVSDENGTYKYKANYIPSTIIQPKPDLTITNISAELKAYEENAIKVEVKN